MTGNVKKRKIVILLLILLLIGILAALFLLMRTGGSRQGASGASGASGPRIYATGATAEAGGEFYVDVNVAENPGFAGIILEMSYDEETLIPIEVQSGSLTAEGLIDSRFGDGSLMMTWFDVEDITDDGGLFTVKFRAAGSAVSGSSSPLTLAYDQGNASNAVLQDVDFNLVSADIRIR
jgi:ABC-type Na+ efflux pump permease subunit